MAKTSKQNKNSFPESNVWAHSKFTEEDVFDFQCGNHFSLYNIFGAHPMKLKSVEGTYFAVWAPNARSVSVIGHFNHWVAGEYHLYARWDSSGIWEGFIPGVLSGEAYKYAIATEHNGVLQKADPFANFAELRPKTASIAWQWKYKWKDTTWLKKRASQNLLAQPCSVYEVHLGSWQRDPSSPERFLSYAETADRLIPYVLEMGFTHVEFMPVMEHPFDGSWGYQVTGYFAPSARFGSPQDFAQLVDRCHTAGIGVILDWVPAHFPEDAHALHRFDGSALYEHEDPRKGYHPDWKTYIFNLGRGEVRSFVKSSAAFWLDVFHIDALRVDAVASMLYLDYSREAGQWVPNYLGGRENLDSVSFFKELNEALYSKYPGIQTIAEESTSWSGVSHPTYAGGLGFGMKWMMGWMNDSLRYFERDPFYRQHHQNELTFSLVYAFTENFMLPLSHDEVVHGKRSMVYKMPGDDWQRMANLKLLYGWMFTHPGAKLLFMGCEFGQTNEWNHETSLDWHLLDFAPHQGVLKFVKALNALYRSSPALYELGMSPNGFQWIDNSDHANSVIVFLRRGHEHKDDVVVAMNMTPVPRHSYRIGIPSDGIWNEVLNSDDSSFGGSGVRNASVVVEDRPWQGRSFSAEIHLPPLGIVVIRQEVNKKKKRISL